MTDRVYNYNRKFENFFGYLMQLPRYDTHFLLKIQYFAIRYWEEMAINLLNDIFVFSDFMDKNMNRTNRMLSLFYAVLSKVDEQLEQFLIRYNEWKFILLIAIKKS